MKYTYKFALLIALVLIFGSTVYPMSNGFKVKTDEEKRIFLQKFAHKYAPPKDLCELIEQHKSTISSCAHKSFYHNHIPGFIIKQDAQHLKIVDRLMNAEYLRSYIKNKNFDRLDVAQKYIYNINNTWFIFSKKVEIAPNSNMAIVTSADIPQIYQTTLDTGYCDWAFHKNIETKNWLREKDTGKFVCIDTEDRSFFNNSYYSIARLYNDTILAQLASSNIITQNAGRWLQAQEHVKCFIQNYDIIKNQEKNTFDIAKKGTYPVVRKEKLTVAQAETQTDPIEIQTNPIEWLMKNMWCCGCWCHLSREPL